MLKSFASTVIYVYMIAVFYYLHLANFLHDRTDLWPIFGSWPTSWEQLFCSSNNRRTIHVLSHLTAFSVQDFSTHTDTLSYSHIHSGNKGIGSPLWGLRFSSLFQSMHPEEKKGQRRLRVSGKPWLLTGSENLCFVWRLCEEMHNPNTHLKFFLSLRGL